MVITNEILQAAVDIQKKSTIGKIEVTKEVIHHKVKVNPESLAGKALRYTLNEWEYLQNRFCSGELKCGNNYIEKHIRSFKIGRKNGMLSVKPESAVAVL